MATKQQPELIAAKEGGRDPGISNTLVSLLVSPVIAMEDVAQAGVENLKNLRDHLSHNEIVKGENRVDDVNDTTGIIEEVEKLAEDSSTKDKQTICPEEGPNQEENKHMVDGGETAIEESLNQGEWKVATEANEVENEQLEVVTAERKEEDPIRGIIHKDQEAEIDDMLQENDNYVTNDDISSIAKEYHLAAQPAEEVETSKVISSKADGDSKRSNEQETAVGELSKVNNTVRESTEKLREDGELNPAKGTTTDHKKNDVFATTERGSERSVENDDKKPTKERNVEEPKHDATPVQTEFDCPAEEETTARHIEEKEDELLFTATKTDVETTTAISTKIEDENGNITGNLTPTETIETLSQYNVSEGKPVHPEIKIADDCGENKDVALEDTSADNIPSENEDATSDQTEKDCPAEEEKGEIHIEEITREPQLQEKADQFDGSCSDEKVETTDFISPKIDEEENVVKKFSSVNDTNTYLDNLASGESPETLKECKIPEGNPVDADNIKTASRDPENATMPIEVELAEEPLQHATPDIKENDPAEAESGRQHVVETTRELELQEEADELLSKSTKTDVISLKEDETVEHCKTPDQTENGCPTEEEMGERHVKEEPRELELQEEAEVGFSDEAGVENQKKHIDNSTIENDQLPHEPLKGENGVDDVNYTGEEEIQPRHELSFDTMKEGEEDKAKTHAKTEREQNYAVNYITGEVEKLAEDSSTKDKQILCPEGLVPNQEENKHMADGGEIKTQETLSQTIPLSLVGDGPVEESLKQGEWKVATEANEVENEQMEVVTAERKEEDPIRAIIHKDQEAEIDDMLQESDNYVTNDDILARSAIEQTKEVIKEADEAADTFQISSFAKEDHLAAQPAEEVETSKVISSKPDGDSKGSNEQETVSPLEKLALRESTEKLREDGELNPANGTTTDHKKNDVFATTDTGTDGSENADKKPTEEENVEEPKHNATPVQTENDFPKKEETTARHTEEMAREQELHEKDDELLFAATKADVETNTSPDNLTPIERVETLAQYNVSEGKSVHPEIKITADCEKNKDVALDDTSAYNESVKIPSEDENVEELNEDATLDQSENDRPGEEKGQMHIEGTREPELKEKAAQLLPKTTKADISYSDEKVETTDVISPKIDEEENVVRKFSSVNDTNTYLDNLASRESPETLKECKIPEGSPVDVESINKHMPIEVELAEEALQHATSDKKENDPAEAESRHVVETARELELQEEGDELLTGTKKMQSENEYIEEQCLDETLEQTEFECSAEEETRGSHAKGKTRELEFSEKADELQGRSTKTEVTLKEDETVEHCQGKTPDQTENGCPAEEDMGERHVKEETSELELQEEADGLPMATTKTNADAGSSDEKMPSEGEIVEEPRQNETPCNKENYSPAEEVTGTREVNTATEEFQQEPLTEYKFSDENLVKPDKVTVVDHEMNDVGVEEMTADTSENTKLPSEDKAVEGPCREATPHQIETDCSANEETKEKHAKDNTRELELSEVDDESLRGTANIGASPLKEEAENSNVISSNAVEDINGSNEQETIVGDLSKGNDIAAHLENLTLRESPEQLWEHNELTPANGTTTSYIKTDDFVKTETGADRSESDDKKPREDCNVEKETAGRHIEELIREQEPHAKDDELLFGARKNDVETSEAISTKIGEDENITGKLSPTETLETLVPIYVSEGKPVNPENKTYAGCEKNKDGALEDMSAEQESAKMSSEDENVEKQNKDETPDQTEHDCPAEDEKRETHIEETTREAGLQEEDNESLFKTTKAGVSYADEKMPVEEPPQHAILEETENDPAEGRYVNETSREHEIQEEADESLIGRKKTDLGSSNIDEKENSTGKLSLENDINNAGTSENAKIPRSEDENIEEQCQDETLEKRELDHSTEEETRGRHAKEITRELELQKEADELPMTTKTDVGYSDEKVETFRDMSPKDYEDENIVHKLSEVEPAEEPLQHATPDKKENDPEEAESSRQHVVETSRELELLEEADELQIGTKKMPSEEEIVEEPRQDATLCNKEKYSHVEEEMGTRHVNTATEEQETLIGYKFSDENLVKQDKITVADHEKKDVGFEDITPDTSENAKLPSEEKAVEELSRDDTPCQLEIDCSGNEETRETHDKQNTKELELSKVADELLRGTTNIDASPLKEEVQTSKVLSTNIDEEENIYEKLSPANDANTYEGGNPIKRDDKINNDHESSSIIKEDHLEEQPVEEKDKKGLELIAKDLEVNMAEKIENSNVISSNAEEDSKGSDEQETSVGDLSNVNNIVTHLENPALRESPEQLREHSELTPATGSTTTHGKTDDIVTIETGVDIRENDDKKLRDDETVEEPDHDATLAQTENYCNVEEETAGRHAKETTREPELHEIDDEFLSGPRKTDVEISKAISMKIGEDETNTKLDDLTPTETLETLVQYNVSEGKPVNPENKPFAGCEKNKVVALEDISADQESAKIPNEDDETVEEQNKDETPDQSHAEDEKGERHIEETTRESELQEEVDELLLNTTKVGPVNDDIAKDDMSSHSTKNAMMSIEDEAVEEHPQHATLEKTENNPSEGRYVKETTREQETQEEVDESLIGSKKTDLVSLNIDEEENNTGKLSLVNDTNNAGTHENAKIPSEDENIEEQCQDETLEKREFDRSAEEEATESHAKETTRELELQEEADELPVATKTDADVGSSDEKVETFKDMSPHNHEDEKIVQKLSPTNDANTNVTDLTSSASAENVLKYNISTENVANQDNKNIAVFEKDNNAAMEDVDTGENAKMSSEEDTVEEPYNPTEVETGTRHVETASKEFNEKVDELVTAKVIFPTFYEKENVPGKLDTNTYLDSQTSTEAPGTLTGLTFSDEKLVKPDKITIVDHEENTVSVEMPSEGKAFQGPYQDATPHQTEIDCSAEEENRKRHDKEKTRELELSEETDKLLRGTTSTDVSSLEEQVETSKDLELQEEADNLQTRIAKTDLGSSIEKVEKLENHDEADKLQTGTAKIDLGSSIEKVEKPENRDNKNKADHENNDSTAREEMSADTSENAKMPSEIEAVEEPFQDETPGKKETDCPAEEETGTRLVETTREELQEEAEEMNRPDVGSSNEKVEIDEEENVHGNLLLVNDTNTYLDSQTSTTAPKTLTESNVSEALPIKLDKTTIADNEKNIDVGIEDMSSDTSVNIKMPSEAQTVEELSMDATLHQTGNDCLTEDETGERPDKEPTREIVFQEEADDLLLGTTKTDVSSLNEKIETSTTISPKIYEEGNVVGKLSLASKQSPEISMEHDTLTIGGQEKNDNDNMEDTSADTGDNAKKQIPREDKSVGEPCRDTTVDQTGKHGHAEEETNGRHVKETTKIPEIQQDDHDLLTGDTKTETDISKVMSPKTDEGSKVSIAQENIAVEYQQESNKTTDMDNLASKESPENSIEYSVFEGQAGSPTNFPTSDQEKSNDDALVDNNPLSLVESEKPRNAVDEDQEDSAEGDDKHKGEESKRTEKIEDHTVTQLESKEEAFSKENETSSEVDSIQQQNEEKTKLSTMTHDMTQYEDAILGRNVQVDKEELQSESSSKIVPESREVKHEQDERKIDESKNIAEKCLSMESDPISKSSLNETSREEILQASEDRENQNPCEDSPTDTDKHVAQAVTKPNDDKVVCVQQQMETLDSPFAIKAVLGEKGDYHKDDNFINECNIKTNGHESITYPNKDIPQEEDKKGAMDEPEGFHVSSDSNELVTSVSSHDAILNASSGNDVLNLHQKVSTDISLSEEDNIEQGKTVQDEVISREEDVKPKSEELALKEEFLEDGKTKAVESEGQKTNQDEGKYNEETKVESADDIPVIVEATSISGDKAVQKKSHNILSGVGSKVKHSIANIKKAITGKHSNQKPHST